MGKIQLFAFILKLIPLLLKAFKLIQEAKEDDGKVSWDEIAEIVEIIGRDLFEKVTGEEAKK